MISFAEMFPEVAFTDDLVAEFFRGLEPPPLIDVSEWADTHRELDSRSPVPGPWSTDRVPYLREPMNRINPLDPCQCIVMMKAAQTGGTDGLMHNGIGYLMTYVPGPMLAVQSTVDLAKDWSKDRFQSIVDTTPSLQKLLGETDGQKEKDSDNTLRYKRFPGGSLFVAGANSAAGLRSKPIRYLFLDEVDSYPVSAGREGDPVNLARQRTSNFASKKIILISTPTIKGESRIEKAYENSDQRKYFVPCPHCEQYQVLMWDGVKWPEGKPQKAFYTCSKNGCIIEEGQKKKMLLAGEWRATNPGGGDGRTHGYHISTLYSPFKTWADCAIQFVEACPPGKPVDRELLKTFINTVLGETWEELGATELRSSEIHNKRETWWTGETLIVPRKATLLTAGVDIQDDRVEGVVWAWGPGKEGWLIDRWKVLGDPRTQKEVWDDVSTLLSKVYLHESGVSLAVSSAGIDSGGSAGTTDVVLAFCQQNRSKRWHAIKGFKNAGKPIWTGIPLASTKTQKRKACYPIGTYTAKSWVYAAIHDGKLHFPKVDWCDADFFTQLCVEKLKSKQVGGYKVSFWWKPDHARNEMLDVTVYALGVLDGLLAGGKKLDRVPDGVVTAARKPDKKTTDKRPVTNHHLPDHLENWLR